MIYRNLDFERKSISNKSENDRRIFVYFFFKNQKLTNLSADEIVIFWKMTKFRADENKWFHSIL